MLQSRALFFTFTIKKLQYPQESLSTHRGVFFFFFHVGHPNIIVRVSLKKTLQIRFY